MLFKLRALMMLRFVRGLIDPGFRERCFTDQDVARLEYHILSAEGIDREQLHREFEEDMAKRFARTRLVVRMILGR